MKMVASAKQKHDLLRTFFILIFCSILNLKFQKQNPNFYLRAPYLQVFLLYKFFEPQVWEPAFRSRSRARGSWTEYQYQTKWRRDLVSCSELAVPYFFHSFQHSLTSLLTDKINFESGQPPSRTWWTTISLQLIHVHVISIFWLFSEKCKRWQGSVRRCEFGHRQGFEAQCCRDRSRRRSTQLINLKNHPIIIWLIFSPQSWCLIIIWLKKRFPDETTNCETNK